MNKLSNKNKGYVYILSNPAIPGLLKVGQTTADPRQRASQLFTTGVPEEFVIEFILFSEEPNIAEKEFHKEYENKKSPRREFFKMSIEDAVSGLFRICVPDMEARLVDEVLDHEDHFRYSQMAGVHPFSLMMLLDELTANEWRELALRHEYRLKNRGVNNVG